MRKILLAAALLLVATNIQAQRDTRAHGEKNLLSFSGETLKMKSGEVGYGGAISYDRKLKSKPFWIGLQARGACAHDSLASQILAGLDMTLSYRAELGSFYLQPKGMFGVGMSSQNRIVSNGNRFIEQFPFLCLEAGGRIELGFKVKSCCFGLYGQYIYQFAEPQQHSAGAAVVEKEWLVETPFSAGFVFAISLDKATRHVGGNNVPLIEGFATYGTYGLESGVKLLFNENRGLPWLRENAVGLRGEFACSEQYGLRLSETLGDIKRTSAMLGYGFFFHPTGPDAVLCYRVMGWAGLGEASSYSEYHASAEYVNDYMGSVDALQTGIKGNLEAEVMLHLGRFTASLMGGLSCTKVFGTQTAGIVKLDEETLENPWAFYAGVALGFAL